MARFFSPTVVDIKNHVEKYEKESREWDKTYSKCLNDVCKKGIRKINEKDISIIKEFLVKWGKMARVLGKRKIWKSKLPNVIRDLCRQLEEFRKLRLENSDINEYEIKIFKCYENIKEIIGPTSAAKVLHLICPNFFPIWDSGVRDKTGVNERAEGYFNFIKRNKEFIVKYNDILEELAKKYKKPKVKIVDECFYMGKQEA